MATGMAFGSFAQGLGEGFDAGTRTAMAAEKYKLERPALLAAAEKGKQELAFQQDYAERLKGLYAEAEGGEVTNPDGTVTRRAPMSAVAMEIKSADLMKQSMVKAGLMDFKRLTEARTYSKMIEEEGVLEAMDYAIKNPNDQAGIRERFNSAGKVKLGEDVNIGIESGEFGAKVVGTRVGAGGKVEKVFDGADLLRPYISASTYATLQNQKDIASAKEKGDDRRTGASNSVQLQLGKMREDAANARLTYQEDRENARLQATTDKDAQKSVLDIANTNVTSSTRNLTVKEDAAFVTNINREAAGLASRMVIDKNDPYYRQPQAAFDAAFKEVARRYKVNIASPTFTPTTPPKK